MLKEDYGIPVYTQTGTYAKEHGELDLYRASLRANIACRDAIEAAISENYRDNHLNEAGAQAVLAQYSTERVQYVLANTIRQKEHDGRISYSNKEWARRIPACPKNNEGFIVNKAHPGLLDIFIRQVRQEISLANERAWQEQLAAPLVDENTSGLKVPGYVGTWHTISKAEVPGQTYYLMEHDKFGDETAAIIVDSQGKLILEEIWNGFDEETMEQLQEAAFSGHPLPTGDQEIENRHLGRR